MATRRLVPMFDRVLAQRLKPTRMVGGIVLPESALERGSLNEARVVAVGRGHRSFDGKYTTPSVSVGDTIILGELTTEVSFEGQDFVLLREEDILGVIQEAGPAGKGVPDIRDLPR